jgi:hypothetical protein
VKVKEEVIFSQSSTADKIKTSELTSFFQCTQAKQSHAYQQASS